jgi:hypothetical protein
MRASTADRERAIDVLKAAFSEGRLTKDEFEQRSSQVYRSRTYAELAVLTGDLPVGPLGALAQAGPGGSPYPVAPHRGYPSWPARPPLNSLAVAALICSVIPGFPQLGGLAAGLTARRQIRESGERGDAIARAAIIISSAGILLFVLLFLFWV